MEIKEIFISSFVEAVVDTFAIQVRSEVKPQAHYIIKPNDKFLCDISGTMSINSNEFKGSLSILFEEAIFLKIVSKMLSEEQNEVTNENESGAGELANIIMGQAKRKLNELYGYSIALALPTIVYGKGHAVRTVSQEEKEGVIIPFLSNFGTFHIKISVGK